MQPLIFGMPTLLELPDLAACVALCREQGLSFVELNMNLPQYQLERLDAAKLRKWTEETGIFFTLHLDERLDVCDFNARVADAYEATVLEAIALAKRVGMPLLNLHMAEGVYFKMPHGRVYLYDSFRDTYLARLQGFRDACTHAIGGDDIHIYIENCDGYLPFVLDGIALLLESPAFALTLDIGHAHVASYRDAPFWQAHGDKLCHMHVHDARGQENHLPLGEGELDIAEMLALAKARSCRCVLEIKTVEGLRAGVRYLREQEIFR